MSNVVVVKAEPRVIQVKEVERTVIPASRSYVVVVPEQERIIQ